MMFHNKWFCDKYVFATKKRLSEDCRNKSVTKIFYQQIKICVAKRIIFMAKNKLFMAKKIKIKIYILRKILWQKVSFNEKCYFVAI